jgi:hypothetical protein
VTRTYQPKLHETRYALKKTGVGKPSELGSILGRTPREAWELTIAGADTTEKALRAAGWLAVKVLVEEL